MADEIEASLRDALFYLAAEKVVGFLADRFLVKPKPFPGSEAISQASAEQLQPRTTTPDLPLTGLHQFSGHMQFDN